MKKNRMARWFAGCAAAVVATGLVVGAAHAESRDEKNPAKGTPYQAILDGLKLIKNGDFDKWVSTYCSAKELCYNDNSISSLKRYNLPALQRIAPKCLKGAEDTLTVTREDKVPDNDSATKIFVLCDPAGMPRPFHLVKEDGAWKFTRI